MSQSPDILQTKLRVPSGRPRVVPRPQLRLRLDAGLYRKLTLISAPAGFGKTTLAREWVTSTGLPTAWLSLEPADRPTWRFLTYLLASLRQLFPDLELPLSGPLVEPFLTLLVNELGRRSGKFLLVLDDLHLVESPEISGLLRFFVDHLPESCHLVLLSRETPDLPLAQYRIRDQVTEVGMGDLKFSPQEAGIFFHEVMEIALDDEESTEVVDKTEGWVAGLQAAALSMRQSGSRSGSIPSSRSVVQFLEGEVLHRQPDAIQAFLLDTSIVEELCGSLCDALCGPEAPTLQALDRAQLFLVPLDVQGRWYRYHHLFREMLLRHLEQELPHRIPLLHRRASRWYAEQEQWAAAARHAVAGEDLEQAARLLERAWDEMSDTGQGERWRGWVASLPADLVRAHPVLSAQCASFALVAGEFAESELRLQDAECVREGARVPNPDLHAALPSIIAIGRAYLAQAFGDVATTISWTERVLAPGARRDPVRDMQARALLGLAHWSQGDLERARSLFARNLRDVERSGSLFDVLSLAFVLADITVGLGQLTEAERICHRALERVDRRPPSCAPGVEDLHRMLAEIALERGELSAARAHLQRAADAGEVSLVLGWRYRYLVSAAWLEACCGDTEAALRLLEEAEHAFFRTPLPELRPLHAVKARVWRMGGRTVEAALVGETTEYEALTRARLLASEEALELLERWRARAEADGRTRSVMEIVLLQAMHHERRGDGEAALCSLRRALELAAREGHRQLFTNEGPAVAELRRRLSPGAPHDLLSQRELEVLQLLAQGMSNLEIGRRLFLALDTVKGHNRRIFQKLRVRRRTEAIAEARRQGLLP
jgi:LuxR family maltose regulon positive regulatory protein